MSNDEANVFRGVGKFGVHRNGFISAAVGSEAVSGRRQLIRTYLQEAYGGEVRAAGHR